MSNIIQKAADAKNQLKKTEENTMQSYVMRMEHQIKKALPSTITPERFTRMVLTAMSSNPELAATTPKSFLGAMMTAAQLGLEPNTPLGQAYLIPYKNKNVPECQFQIGYKGMIDLAYRSGEIEIIQAHTVYQNDEFEYELGLNPKLKHVPADGDRGDPVKYYAVFRTKNGGYGFDVMSVDDIKRHAAKYSKGYSSSYSPWNSNFDEMAKKTVLKRVLKYAPLKSDFVRAVSMDGSIKEEISDDMYSVQNTISFDQDYEVADQDDENREQHESDAET